LDDVYNRLSNIDEKLLIDISLDNQDLRASMNGKSKTRIAIIGGGVGGTALAGLLQRYGYACTIYEQAPDLRSVGAGINFAANATRAFSALGLMDRAIKAGLCPTKKTNRTWDTDETFYSVDIPELAKKYGSPFIAFHRGKLHDVLASSLQPGTFKLGKRFKSLAKKNDAIEIAFEDGTKVEADAVVGADGLNSRVRATIRGDGPPVYFGHAAYRSVFPTSALPNYDFTDHLRWWGPTSYLLVYKMTEARDEVNIVAGAPEDWESDDFSPQIVSRDRLLAIFEGYHPNVQAVLESCTQVSRWPMMIRSSSLPWSDGAVTLMGDAAHPMTPHLGQGGGMAMEDAVMLARCIETVNGEDMELAFRFYEASRFERTAKVQSESQKNLIGKGGADHDWLYSYDILTAPISSLE
jgi:6-hydroxynicotinate 3-monooxygenase